MQAQLKNICRLVLCLLLCLGVGYIGSIFTQTSVVDWYPILNKPPGTPPPAAFAPVWTLLYLMMGLSLWLAGNASLSKQGYALFSLQLLFNLLWSFLFFGMQNILLGFIDIVLIDLTTVAAICAFWKHSRIAAILLMPYLAWLLYATYLNLGILILN
jgi:tryptophan-rich sensory protein